MQVGHDNTLTINEKEEGVTPTGANYTSAYHQLNLMIWVFRAWMMIVLSCMIEAW